MWWLLTFESSRLMAQEWCDCIYILQTFGICIAAGRTFD